MVHFFSEHLSPVEEAAGNKKNRRAQRFGELQPSMTAESPLSPLRYLGKLPFHLRFHFESNR